MGLKRWLSLVLLVVSQLFFGRGVLYGQGLVASDSLPDNLYNYLVNSSSRHFHDPSIPRFLIKDRSYNFILGIGGYVQGLAFYDMAGMDELGFMVSNIPDGTANFKNTDVMGYDLAMSRVYFKLIGVTPKGYITSYVETDFNGENNALRLRQAYVQFMGITVGQKWTTFRSDESPNTLDIQGAPSLSDRRHPLVSYTYEFGKRKDMKLIVALELPGSTTMSIPDQNGAYYVEKVFQDIPDIPVSFHLKRDRWYLFLATNFRSMKYPISDGKFSKTLSYAFSGNVRFNFYETSRSSQRVYLQSTFARGMVDCIQDLDGKGMNILISPTFDKLGINSAFGFSGAYQFLWGKNQINAIYSMVRVYGDMLKYDDSIYNKGQYIALNYMRNILTHGVVGVEALYGDKRVVGGQMYNDLRFNFLLRYDF